MLEMEEKAIYFKDIISRISFQDKYKINIVKYCSLATKKVPLIKIL